ncbi:MAG: signal recognition particle receptor subunit alpha, partial [Clostridia bacterium]
MGLFDKLKKSLFKTRENLTGKMDDLVENYKPAPKGPYRPLGDDFYEDLSDILIMADVGVKTTQ